MIIDLELSQTSPFSSPELWEIPKPPKIFYVRGKEDAFSLLKMLPEKGLAIVGTRAPQLRSLQFLKRQMKDLKNSHLIIVSGLAQGIDTEAHVGALEMGLPTIAVIGSGLDKPYPQENKDLMRKIIEAGGLIVSEYPRETLARNYHFLARNRIIAGWSKATWVVEASQRSGALNTARWARDQGRACFAVPGYPGDWILAGNQTLIDRDCAVPYWGVHSLGAAWIQLATTVPLQPGKKSQPLNESELLCHFVEKQTLEKGAVELTEVFNWALSQGWTPRRFYQVFEQATERKHLKYENRFVITC